MQGVTYESGDGRIRFGNRHFVLEFAEDSGLLLQLRCPSSPSVPLLYRGREPGVCVDARVDGEWLVAGCGAELAGVKLEEGEGYADLVFDFELGPAHKFRVVETLAYQLRVTYRVWPGRPYLHRGAVLRKNRLFRYYDQGVSKLMGARYLLPGACVGAPSDCTFEMPMDRHRPRTPYAERARLGRTGVEGQHGFFCPLSSPDNSPGLLAVHNAEEGLTLLAWSWTAGVPSFPEAVGDGAVIDLGHEVGVADWVLERRSEDLGGQYVGLVRGSWADALAAFGASYAECGLAQVDDRAGWVEGAVVREVEPYTEGGFDAMRAKLPAWAEEGVTCLYMLPTYTRPWPGMWGVVDYYREPPELGGNAACLRMVQRAHELGMRVIGDLLITVQPDSAVLVAEHPDWFITDEHKRAVPSSAWGGWSLDWANEGYRAYIEAFAVHCAREMGLDGFRVDVPEHKEVNWGSGFSRRSCDNVLASVELMRRVRAAMRAVNPEAALLSESCGPLFHTVADMTYDQPVYVVGWVLEQLIEGRWGADDFKTWLADNIAALPAGAVRALLVRVHDSGFFTHVTDHPLGLLVEELMHLLSRAVMTYEGGGFCGLIGDDRRAAFRALAALRRAHPALATAEVVPGAVSAPDPVFTWARRAESGAYVIAANLSASAWDGRLDVDEAFVGGEGRLRLVFSREGGAGAGGSAAWEGGRLSLPGYGLAVLSSG